VDFRCAAASLEHADALAGTASVVRAFLLVEHAGPWGVDALRDCRLPEPVCAELRRRTARAGVRPLLVRRHGRTTGGGGVRVFAAYADPHRPWIETAGLATVEEVLDLDLEALGRGGSTGLARSAEPVFCVCTHGRHDACCAERGRPTMRALAVSHPEHSWEVSHIGGDRFAANVLVLPDGLYYGRVQADEVSTLAQRHLDGHLDLPRLRGRSGFSFPVQAAEIAVRRLLGETRLAAVRLLGASTDEAGTEVRLEVAGERYDVRVRPEHGRGRLLTCRSGTPLPPLEQRVLSVTGPDGAASSAPSSPGTR
jgi:hypothetical protein